MNEPAQSATRGWGSFLAIQSNGATVKPLTRMSLVHIEQRINIWLRFGHPVRRRRVDRWQCQVYFEPSATFCRVRYDSNERCRTFTRLMVLQAGLPLDAMESVLGVAPGARLLLHAGGKLQVRLLLEQMADIEALGIDLAAVSPTYWRTLQNRLAAQMPWPAYTIERHAAHLAGGRL